MRRWTLGVLVAAALGTAASGGLATAAYAATASPTPIVAKYVESADAVTFDATSTATTATFSVHVINLTGTAAPVVVSPTKPQEGCRATAEPSTLPAASQTTVKVTLVACKLSDAGGLRVYLTVATTKLPAFSVSAATTPTTTTPNWTLLAAFPIAMAVAVALLSFIMRTWKFDHEKEAKRWWTRHGLHLGVTWSLKDSWASNLTVVAAAFAGVFGSSDVLKAALGSDTASVFALTTVSAAIAVGVVSSAPLALSVLRYRGNVTPRALLVGAALTVGGVLGELWVIGLGVWDLDLGGWQYAITIGGLTVGTLLIGIYSIQTMTANLAMKATHHTHVHKDGDVYQGIVDGEEIPDDASEAPELPRRSAVF